jgi:hypothetical protein
MGFIDSDAILVIEGKERERWHLGTTIQLAGVSPGGPSWDVVELDVDV